MEEQNMRDEELMIQYSTGNTEALEEIFQRYKKAMFNYAFRMLSHRADAEDVVGEVFYILTREKDRYRPKGKFSTWLYTIALSAGSVYFAIIRTKDFIAPRLPMFLW